jgi:hypothetical protein
MMMTLLKIVLGAGLAIISLGIFPDRLRGSILAVASCVVAAILLHFVAPEPYAPIHDSGVATHAF